MTLLRMNGIPARWQSGWIFSDGDYDNMHDWGWLYLAPYGWVPMDVTFGRLPGAEAVLVQDEADGAVVRADLGVVADVVDDLEGAQIWTGHGVLAHNLLKISALAA